MLHGKSAIVTGSTSGIGLGIAEALAEAGANVMLNGFGEPAAIEALCAGFAARHTGKVVYSGADVSRPDEIDGMVAQARAAFGQIDIIVNNAGIQHVAPVHEFPIERWNAVLATNLTAPFLLIRAVLPEMLARNWGRIINIASTHGSVASANKAAYVSAKHGLLGLTKTVALELATTGVTCNAICPGWVLTPLVQKQIDELAAREGLSGDQARIRLLGEKQPSLRFTTPADLGALAVFLCSAAAGNMQGVGIPVDGGWLAQ